MGLLAGAALSLVWLVHPYYDATNDGSMFIATTRSLLDGAGYSMVGEPFVMRPPGFSILLLPVMGSFGTDFLALNVYVSLYGVMAVGLLFVYLRPQLGSAVSAALAVTVWLNPGFRELSTQVLSDIPGVAFLLLGLITERWARERPDSRRDFLLGAVLAAGAFVRTGVVLLVPAILLARTLERIRSPADDSSWSSFGFRRLAPLVLVPVLALGAWSVRNSIHPPPAPAEQTLNHSYWVAQWHSDRGDPASPLVPLGEVLARVPQRLESLLPLLGSRMISSKPHPMNVALGALALLCSLWVAVRRREAGQIYVFGLLPVLLLYFAFATRLVLPIYVLVLPAIGEVLLGGLERVLEPRKARAALAVLVLLLGVWDAAPQQGWQEVQRRHAGYQRVAEYIRQNFPPGTAVAASQGYHHAVFLDRPVASVQWAVRRDGLAAAYRIIEEHDVRVLLANRFGEEVGGVIFRHFSERFGIERAFVDGPVIRIPAGASFDPGAKEIEVPR
jgi:4-amino-4-deoxy-L-arabinose transferase-like glycosyltransferase